MGAVLAVARVELRRRWRNLLVVGILAGLVGGAVLGSVAAARRTSTAPSRLAAASSVADARVTVFGGPELAADVTTLPAVDEAWVAGLHVASVAGDAVFYVAVLAGGPKPAGVFSPVVVDGRPARPSRADEVVVTQQYADALDLRPGDTIDLDLLAAEEVAQFDVGFGEPDGPEVLVTVTGVVRVAGAEELGPVHATPAFAEAYGATRAGSTVLVQLAEPFADLRAQLDALAPPPTGEGAEEFSPLQLDRPSAVPAALAASARVLTTGLGAFAAVAAAVGALAVAQALGRSHAAGAADQRTESALGLTTGQRVAGRAVPALLAGGIGAALAGGLAVAAGRLEPLGAVAEVEPSPGWSPNVALAVFGGLAVGVAVVGLAAATAWRAGRPARAQATRPAATPPLVGRRPWMLAAFALLRGRGVPVRSSVAGVVIGIAGAVAAFSVAASLDRLEAEPARYGWPGDFTVVDATDASIGALRDDPRIGRIALVRSTTIEVAGDVVDAYAIDDLVGRTSWTMHEGRMPAARAELVLGRSIARRLDLEVGDHVDRWRLVGIGIGPAMNGEVLGEQALVTPGELDRAALAQPFLEALAAVRPAFDEEAVTDEYAARYELGRDDPPQEVDDLLQLGVLPEVLAAFLLVVAALALAHTLVAATARRRRDLAVLRSIGFTPRQAGAAVVAAGMVIVVGSVAVGVPVGLGLGRLVWWIAASGVGIGADLAEPRLALAVLLPGALLAVAVLAALPARRATTVSPALALRTE